VTKKIGIAVIGAGRAGMIHGKNFRYLVPNAALVAIVDPDEELASKNADDLELETYYTDYREALGDPKVDAIVIVTPTKYHCEIAIAAAAAKKHILCEKPMAMNVAECEKMEAAAGEHGVLLQMGFMRRYDQSFLQAKEAVSQGVIGEVVMVRSNTRGPSIPQPWMYDIQKSNGPLAEVNSHDLDTLRWLTGSEFETIYAIGGNYRCRDIAQEYPDFYDNVVLTATFEKKMQGCIDGAQGVGYGYDARVEILGTKGCIFLGKTRENSLSICTADKRIGEEFVNSWTLLFKDAYLEEDMDFVKCILEDRQPRATAKDGKKAVQAVEAGNLSIKEKRVITLNQE